MEENTTLHSYVKENGSEPHSTHQWFHGPNNESYDLLVYVLHDLRMRSVAWPERPCLPSLSSWGIMGTDSVMVSCLGSRRGQSTSIDSRRGTKAVSSTLGLLDLCLPPDTVPSSALSVSGSLGGW